MKPAKAMTIRLSAEQAEELETVATVDNQPISEVIRAAIAEHITERKADVGFQDSLRERIERAQRMLADQQRK
jgi:predicted transcriptional regulator